MLEDIIKETLTDSIQSSENQVEHTHLQQQQQKR